MKAIEPPTLQPSGPLISIVQALDETLLKSPRAAAFRAVLGIARSGYWAASVMPNPVLFFDRAPRAEQVRRIGPQITWDPPWKLAFRLLAAKRFVDQTRLEILLNLWHLRADVRRAYTEFVVAQETAETLSQLVDLARRLLDVAQKRFTAGDVPELDVLKARLATSQAEIDLEQGLRRIVRARQQLNVIMGRDVNGELQVPRLPPFKLRVEKNDLLPNFEEPVPPLTDYIAQAMENRLELKGISQQIKVANAQLLNAWGNIPPDPTMTIGNSVAGNPPLGPKLRAYFVTLNLELPALNVQQGEIARLKATIKQLKAQYASQQNVVISEVSAAYQNLLTFRERIRVYQEHVLADSQEVARLARRSYEVGQSDITSTLQAQQANFNIRNLYLDNVSAYQQSFIDLEQSIGKPLQ